MRVSVHVVFTLSHARARVQFVVFSLFICMPRFTPGVSVYRQRGKMRLDLTSIDIQEQKITSSHEQNDGKFSQCLWQVINHTLLFTAEAFIVEFRLLMGPKCSRASAKIKVSLSEDTQRLSKEGN